MKKARLYLTLASIVATSFAPSVVSAKVLERSTEIVSSTQLEECTEELDYASMISSAQLPGLVEEIKAYMEAHPELSDEEYNDYFKALIIENYDEELMALDNVPSACAYDYANSLPVVSSRLGATEKAVFNSDPVKGGFVLVNAQAAMDMTSQHWKNTYGYHNDNGDAFRHTLWNAYNAHDCGVTYAKKFADAHEKDNPNAALETSMDLFNNELGRTIGSKSYSGNSSQVSYTIRQNVLKAIKNGQGRRFVGGDIGTKTSLQKTNSNGIK